MSKAQLGDTVKVMYIGSLNDGTVFDQSKEDAPIQFTLGKQQLLPGFELAVIDMEVGETKKITIPAQEAYGEHLEDSVVEVTRSRLPDNLEPKIGQRLEVQDKDGNPLVVTITNLTENMATLDANHSLAGKDLTFEITLSEIVT